MSNSQYISPPDGNGGGGGGGGGTVGNTSSSTSQQRQNLSAPSSPSSSSAAAAASNVVPPDLLSDETPMRPSHGAGSVGGEIQVGESDSPYVKMEWGEGTPTTSPGPPAAILRNPDATGRKTNGNDDDEDDGDDDDSYDKGSILSSVLTADGIHDPTGFFIVCFVILVGDMCRGVMFPTMWPLVESLGGTTVALGYAVAAFSFGRILVSPLFGSWSVTYGYTKTLLFSTSILLFGALMYAQVGNVGKPEFLILSQTVLGIGSGTLGVTRAFVAEVTAQRNRTKYMAWLTAVQYGGFTATPFVGALFAKIFQDEERHVNAGLFVLDQYTAPAYFMVLMCIITLVLLSTLFQDRHRYKGTANKKQSKMSKRRAAIDELANSGTLIGLTTYDACILGCMLLNVATKGSIASFETLGIALAESHFNMFSARAGAIVASCGSLGVISLLCVGHLSKYVTDIQLIWGGMLVMGTGILSLTGLADDVKNPDWKYILAIFMIYSIGYPIGHTAVIGLFSKIVGRRPQGTLLGWFASAGSLARMIFPIMSGYIATYNSIITLFIVLAVVLGGSIGFTILNKDTLTMLSS